MNGIHRKDTTIRDFLWHDGLPQDSLVSHGGHPADIVNITLSHVENRAVHSTFDLDFCPLSSPAFNYTDICWSPGYGSNLYLPLLLTD